jgi:hemoglobin-like flavoprotein
MTPHLRQLTACVYDHLFRLHPETRTLFSIDMHLQGKHFAAALALIVRNLEVLDALEQPLRELGAAHAKVGVRLHHYSAVYDAMVQAMADTLGEQWTEQLASDWRWLLDTVARQMLVGANDS